MKNNNQQLIKKLKVLNIIQNFVLISIITLILGFVVSLLFNTFFEEFCKEFLKKFFEYGYIEFASKYIIFSVFYIPISIIIWEAISENSIYTYLCNLFENLEYKIYEPLFVCNMAEAKIFQKSTNVKYSLTFEDKINKTQIMDLNFGVIIGRGVFRSLFKGLLLKIDLKDEAFKGCTIIQSANNYNSEIVKSFNEIKISYSQFIVHSDLPENEVKTIIEPFLIRMKHFKLLSFYQISSITINNGQIFTAIKTGNVNIFKVNLLTTISTFSENGEWYKAMVEVRQLAEDIRKIQPNK